MSTSSHALQATRARPDHAPGRPLTLRRPRHRTGASNAIEMNSEPPDWESLQGGIDGEVAIPGSPAYRASPPPFNARFRDVRPAAVVSCASPQDVGEAISFARRHGLELAARAGGHSFAAHS